MAIPRFLRLVIDDEVVTLHRNRWPQAVGKGTPPNRPRRGRTHVGNIRQTRRFTVHYPVPKGTGNC